MKGLGGERLEGLELEKEEENSVDTVLRYAILKIIT